jgi:hypothetical protein
MEFLVSMETNTLQFRHYDHNYFSLYINGKQISSDGSYLNLVTNKHPLWDIERPSRHPELIIRKWDSKYRKIFINPDI